MFWEGAMFLRVVRAAGAKGVNNEYVRVVEAYRENGKTRHRTVLNLGRRDLLAAHLDLDKLRRLLHGDAVADRADRAIRREDIGALAAWDWGPMLVAGHLWRELGLEATLDKLAAPARREATRLSDRTLVLVVNRLTAPGSEHGLARWLETDFVCDRCGRRWLAAWRDDDARLASRTPRVRVELRQLKTWYRTLDQLLEHKDTIEHALFIRLRDLFSLQVDMVFYDLTSTYFEGPRATRHRRQWSQPRRQAAQSAGPGRARCGRRLADRASCVCGQSARRQNGTRSAARSRTALRA